MSEGGSRRAVAEIRFGEDRSSITKVSGRSIHQFWSLLGPHFRDVLLAPQRRSDDGGVAWTWREGAEKKPLTAAELAGVRKRLERANDSFAENPVNPLMGDDRSGTSSQALIDQVAARVKAMADSLAAKSDAALSDFVCRTETGIMVHSWGVASPAPVVYPESMETGLSGVVLAGAKRLEGYEVVVENAQGLSVARTRSEQSGEFHFTKIGPGRYRVRVVSGRVKFPVKGVMVTVERGAVARLELRSAADSTDEGEPKENEDGSNSAEETPSSTGSAPPNRHGARGWFGKVIGVIVLLMLLGGGGVWAWRTWWSTADRTVQRTTVHTSSMAPEDFSAGESHVRTANTAGPSAGAGSGLGASVDGVGGSVQHPGLPAVVSASRSVDVAANGRARSPSTIGSRVDVQLGIAAPTSTAAPSSGDQAAVSEAANNSAAEEPVSAPPDLGSEAGAPKMQAAAGRNLKPSAIASPAITGGGVKGGRPPVAALESGLSDDKNRPPGGAELEGAVAFTNQKQKGKAQALGAIPTQTPAAKSREPSGGGEILGNPSTDVPSEAVTINRPPGESVQATGPVSKVLVVNKGPAAEKSLSRNEVKPSADGEEPEDKPAIAPKTATRKPVPKKPGSGGKTPTARGTEAGTPPENPAPENDDVPAPAPYAESNQPPEPSNSLNGKEGVERLAESANGSGAPASAAARAANSESAKSSLAAVRTSAGHSGGMVANKPKSLSGDEASVEQGEKAHLDTPDSRGVTMLSYEIAAVRWDVRLVRNAIVPTVPVRVGEVDSASLVREKLLSERKSRVPEMFKNPATHVGFVFTLPDLPEGGAFYWRDAKDSVKKTSDGNQAEINWAGDATPHGSVFVLVFPDGQEAVHLTVTETGGLLLKLAEGVRGSMRLGVARVISDEFGPELEKRATRFGWHVNGVARKREELKSEDRNHVISFPLEKSKTLRLDVALTDHLTGWALVTAIQLRPKK